MSTVPAAQFLIDFGGHDAVAVVAEETLREAAAIAEVRAEQRREEAYARGLEEGAAAAQAQAEARLEEQKAAFEQQLAGTREVWAREEGARLGELIEAAVQDMTERIAQAAQRVLKPFVVQAVRERAVAELHQTLKELVETNPDVTLEIAGPEDLLGEVRAALSASIATVSYVARDACDVQVRAGASVIETRIGAWLEQIEEARV